MASVHPLVVRPADTPRPASLPPIPGEVDLQEVLRKVWRRKALIVGVTIALTVIAALIIFQITPLYTAYSVVMINDRHTQVVDVEAVVSRLAGDAETIESETEVIKSRGIAAKTVDTLHLQESPEFNSALRPPNVVKALFDPRSWIPEYWLGVIAAKSPSGGVSAKEEVERRRARIVDTFLGKLEYRQSAARE
jgi:polysaccharide biosynthesis transport protein